ncbi:MAG: metallophosphoesterase family protein [Candidatus Methylacidiphilales bacterium]|nr:metallophosphoesterase family protein [Candidatus Methylacidiphilales bacterium]
MRIGILSDTHDHLPASVPGLFAGVDEIWHLGDVCDVRTIYALRELGCPVRVVRGNCDSCTDWPLTLDLERGGVRFHLVHIPPREAPAGCAGLLHGHTHVPRDESVRGVRWLNPGSAGKPNKGAPPSVAFLEVEEGTVRSWKVVRL